MSLTPTQALNAPSTVASARYDAWLEAMFWVARHYSLEFSPESVARLSAAQEDESLSTGLRHIARQMGCTLSVVRLTAEHLSTRRLPVIVQFKDGTIAVLHTVNQDNNVGITYSGDAAAVSTITQQELLHEVEVAVILRPTRNQTDKRLLTYTEPFDPHWLRKIVLRDWRPYAHILIASFAANILALAGILFTRQVYDRVIPAESYPTLYVLFSGVLIAIAFGFVLRKMRARVTDLLGKRADLRISDKVFGHALRIKQSQRPQSTGSYIAQIRELDSIRELLTSTTITAFADLPFFILFCAVFWYIAGSLVWVPIVAVILMVVPGLVVQGRLREYANQALKESTLRNAVLVEAIQANEDIKTLQAEYVFQRQWNHYNAVAADVNLQMRSLVSGLNTWTQSIQTSAFAVIVLFGTPQVIEGDLTTGSLIAASILGSRMIAPMSGLTQLLSRWQQAKAAMHGINQLMALSVDAPLNEKKIHRPALQGSYQLDNTQFFYASQPQQAALEVKRLSIQAGEKIALLGRNGAGKSTLLQALSGLLEPQAGLVTLDGITLQQLDPADVRRDVGLMSQQAVLFHGSLRENLLLGAPTGVSDERLTQVLHMTGALTFINKLPAGLEYQVAEGGKGLSGGQKQSLLLARLLLKDSNVLLLDEPTAALDEQSEKQVIAALQKWGRNKTYVIATHKMSLLQLVDRIVVVDQGRIVLDAPKAVALQKLKAKNNPTPARSA